MRAEMVALSEADKGAQGNETELREVVIPALDAHAVREATEPHLAWRVRSRANYPESPGSSTDKTALRAERGSNVAPRRLRSGLGSRPSLRVHGLQGRRDELLRTLL